MSPKAVALADREQLPAALGWLVTRMRTVSWYMPVLKGIHSHRYEPRNVSEPEYDALLSCSRLHAYTSIDILVYVCE
jgi:hypothetical protein